MVNHLFGLSLFKAFLLQGIWAFGCSISVYQPFFDNKIRAMNFLLAISTSQFHYFIFQAKPWSLFLSTISGLWPLYVQNSSPFIFLHFLFSHFQQIERNFNNSKLQNKMNFLNHITSQNCNTLVRIGRNITFSITQSKNTQFTGK